MSWLDILGIAIIVIFICVALVKIPLLVDIDVMSYIYLWVGVKLIKMNTKLMYRFEKHTTYLHSVTRYLCEFLFKNITHKGEVGVFHVIREALPMYYFKADKDVPIGRVYRSIISGNESINVNTRNSAIKDTPTVRSLFHDRRYPFLQSTRSDWVHPHHTRTTQHSYPFFVEVNYRLRADKNK